MPTRSITDEEIALIKAMLGRGTRNKDIQFLFNRPDRAVNSGRISGIANGTYSNSAQIQAADDALLGAFLESRTAADEAAIAIVVPAAAEVVDDGPLSRRTLMSMFAVDQGGIWRLRDGETDAHECKENFGFRYASKWLRAIAALANNRGGYVFFGVHDKVAPGQPNAEKSHAVIGMASDEFHRSDAADFANAVKNAFDPTPEFSILPFAIGSHTIGVIHVRQHPSRPVIARRNDEGDIKEGDIFYRYPGQSNRIKYSDLRSILDQRDAVARSQILPMVERLLALGPQKAMVADLETGELMDGRTTIRIDESLVEGINFIREGEFDEVAGAPALRIVGDIEVDGRTPQGPAGEIVMGAILRSHVFEHFLDQRELPHPDVYVKFMVDGCTGKWLPIRHYVARAGLTLHQALDLVDATAAPLRRKNTIMNVLGNADAAFQLHGYYSDLLLNEIVAGADHHVVSYQQACRTARALQGLKRDMPFDKDRILALLRTCLSLAEDDRTGATGSSTRKAIARVDEVLNLLV